MVSYMNTVCCSISHDLKIYIKYLTGNAQTFLGNFESKKGRYLVIFGQIWSNFGFKMSFLFVTHCYIWALFGSICAGSEISFNYIRHNLGIL